METSEPKSSEPQKPEAEPTKPEPAKPEPSKMDEFAKTARAAMLSSAFHQTVGFMKRKVGKMTDDEKLTLSGEAQEVLGKTHGLVGAIREVREAASKKIEKKRIEGTRILQNHGTKLLNGATEFVRDLKKFLE